jgi:hypothetical protein
MPIITKIKLHYSQTLKKWVSDKYITTYLTSGQTSKLGKKRERKRERERETEIETYNFKGL